MTVCSLPPPEREKSRLAFAFLRPINEPNWIFGDHTARRCAPRTRRTWRKRRKKRWWKWRGKREEEEKEEERGYGREAARSDMHTRYVIILSSIASDSTLNFSLAARTKIHPRIRLSKWHGLNGNARIYAYDLDVFSRARCFPDPRREAKHVVWRETANRGDRSFDLIKFGLQCVFFAFRFVIFFSF